MDLHTKFKAPTAQVLKSLLRPLNGMLCVYNLILHRTSRIYFYMLLHVQFFATYWINVKIFPGFYILIQRISYSIVFCFLANSSLYIAIYLCTSEEVVSGNRSWGLMTPSKPQGSTEEKLTSIAFTCQKFQCQALNGMQLNDRSICCSTLAVLQPALLCQLLCYKWAGNSPFATVEHQRPRPNYLVSISRALSALLGEGRPPIPFLSFIVF